MKLVKFLLLAGILLASVMASADPITFTEQATISGTLGSGANTISFNNQLLTITFTTDTSLVTLFSPTWYAIFATPDHLAYFTIGNLGQYYFTDPVRVDVEQTGPWGGFHDTNPEGGLMVTFNDAFKTYDLQSSLGPVSGNGQSNTEINFGTSAGGLTITNYGDTTFTAVVATPEPSSLLLMGIGALGVLATVRRKIFP